jgi:2-hydroxy-3-oxopropionate reductase
VTRIAFVGLGIMGLPMATNLVRAGYDVHGYNRSPREKFAEAGGKTAASIARGRPGCRRDRDDAAGLT